MEESREDPDRNWSKTKGMTIFIYIENQILFKDLREKAYVLPKLKENVARIANSFVEYIVLKLKA